MPIAEDPNALDRYAAASEDAMDALESSGADSTFLRNAVRLRLAVHDLEEAAARQRRDGSDTSEIDALIAKTKAGERGCYDALTAALRGREV